MEMGIVFFLSIIVATFLAIFLPDEKWSFERKFGKIKVGDFVVVDWHLLDTVCEIVALPQEGSPNYLINTYPLVFVNGKRYTGRTEGQKEMWDRRGYFWDESKFKRRATEDEILKVKKEYFLK